MANWKIFLIDGLPMAILMWLVYGLDFQPQDWSWLKKYRLGFWETFGIYAVSLFFILQNVLPKYLKFGGAKRHFNDVKDVEEKSLRKFMTKNYIRLGFHILSGVFEVLLPGLYTFAPEYFDTIFSFEFLKYWFVFWDTIHQITIWLMTRNHDGIFAIRVHNLAFGVTKLFFCGEIMKMTETGPDFHAFVGALFIYTSGFAWARAWCFITALGQLYIRKVNWDFMRENWYSAGLWIGQALIVIRMGTLAECNMVTLFTAIYFPIEIWIKDNTKYKTRMILISGFLSPLYWVEDNQLLIQLCILIFYALYTSKFSGLYWKRQPIPGVDHNAEKDSKDYDRRSESYADVMPRFIQYFISNKNQSRFFDLFNDFMSTDMDLRSRSQSVAPGMADFLDAPQVNFIFPSISRARFSTARSSFQDTDLSEMAKLRRELAQAKEHIAVLKGELKRGPDLAPKNSSTRLVKTSKPGVHRGAGAPVQSERYLKNGKKSTTFFTENYSRPKHTSSAPSTPMVTVEGVSTSMIEEDDAAALVDLFHRDSADLKSPDATSTAKSDVAKATTPRRSKAVVG